MKTQRFIGVVVATMTERLRPAGCVLSRGSVGAIGAETLTELVTQHCEKQRNALKPESACHMRRYMFLVIVLHLVLVTDTSDHVALH